MIRTALAVALLAICGTASAQSIGVNITSATGRMAGFQGPYRAYSSSPGTFVASIPKGDGKLLTVVYEDLPGAVIPRQVIRVFLAEWREGMNVTSSAKLPLTGGAAATIGGGGDQTLVAFGRGSPDGGWITLVVTP